MAANDTFSALSIAFIGPLVEHFLSHNPAWSPTRLGKVAVNDPGKIAAMRAGTNLRAGTAKKIIAVIDKEAPGLREKFIHRHAMERHNVE